jgi:hypothetical protein
MQDLDLTLKDIVQVSSSIFEKIKDQVQMLNEAQSEKNE